MSAVMGLPSRSLPAAWRQPLLALGLVLVALVALYWNTWVAMVGIWDRSGTFAHCFLVAPISLWLAWRLRGELAVLAPKPQPWVALLMLLVAAAWLLGDMASVNALTQFAITALLALAVPLVLGWAVARRLTFPLLFLFFMVPFGEFMLPWLMDWTADFTVAAIRLSGIPVYREGLQFVIPSGNWSVVDACSGVRYLIASAMVGSLFAYLNYTSTKRRAMFAVVMVLVPLVANWLRAYMIVMLGHLSGNKLAVGVDHLIYGWVFFGLVIGIMFWIGARWAEPMAEPAPRVAGDEPSPPPAAALWLSAALGCVALLAPQAYAWRLESQAALPQQSSPLALSELQGTRPAAATPRFTPQPLNPTATALRAYELAEGVVYVHVAYYRQQRYGSKMTSSDNNLVKGQDKEWQLTNPGFVQHAGGKAGGVSWRSATLLGGSVGALATQRPRVDVRQIFWVDGHLTASEHRATLFGLWARLAGRGDDGALLTVYTEGGDKAETAARLDAFLRAHTGALERQLVTYRTLR
jgi:exosortase A